MPSRPSHGTRAPSRERLLRAAKRLFAMHGYEQTATSAIAREAGTSESQLMRYFGGKGGLLDALFDEAWDHLNARVTAVVNRSADSRTGILDALETVANALARDTALATLFLFEGRRIRGDEPRIRLSEGFAAFGECVKSLVRKAQAEGSLDPALDTDAMTSALLGAAESLIRDRFIPSGRSRVYAQREVRRTLNAMLVGLAPASRSHARARRSVSAKAVRAK